ncbi:hypothetical protein DL768_007417 [Monosporascus sp. mg162]|nr:hypothetical protein DL768_007417 [Monosporascus sp. mg162]
MDFRLHHRLSSSTPWSRVAALADWVGSSAFGDSGWLRTAAKVKRTTNKLYWDGPAGAFRSNLSPTPRAGIYTQNGNSLAVLFEIIGPSSSRAQDISSLTQNWTPIGTASPELPGEIRHSSRLIRSSWGWYPNNENDTQRTTIEGYIVNGTFGYRWDYGYNGDFSYTSHEQSWATGSGTALMGHVLGWSRGARRFDLATCTPVRGLDEFSGSQPNWAGYPPVGG